MIGQRITKWNTFETNKSYKLFAKIIQLNIGVGTFSRREGWVVVVIHWQPFLEELQTIELLRQF